MSDLSGFAMVRFSELATFLPLNSLPPTTICFDLVFESFLLLRCFSCPLGLAASASLASSSGVSVSRGFPGFLVRVAWSVPVPGELSCCGVCGGLLCVGGLLACASGVSRLWFCRAGCPPFGACPGVRRWASPVASVVRSCSALASSVWSLLPCVPCRLAFGLWWFACPGALRFVGRLGSLRCVLAVVCRWSCGRSERLLSRPRGCRLCRV